MEGVPSSPKITQVTVSIPSTLRARACAISNCYLLRRLRTRKVACLVGGIPNPARMERGITVVVAPVSDHYLDVLEVFTVEIADLNGHMLKSSHNFASG